MVLFAGCGKGNAPRLSESGFKVTFGEHQIPSEMTLGKTIQADINVTNSSDRSWPSKPNANGKHAVNLAYHWLDRQGKVVVYDGERTHFSKNLDPGKSVKLAMTIMPPPRTGDYLLEVTLVQEGVAWFPEKGGDKIELPVRVVADRQEIAMAAPPPTQVPTGADKRNDNDKKDTAKAGVEQRKVARQIEKPDSAVKNVNATKTQEPHRNEAKTTWSVQVGSFPDLESATKRVKGLKDKGHDAYQLAVQIQGKTWHQVRIGHFASRAEAHMLHDRLKTSKDFKRSFVTSRRG